jgi:signal transduction histidine kinase
LTDSADGRVLAERLRAERDERRRLAELIHDGPVQLVAAIAQMLDAAHHALADGDVTTGAAVVARALEVAREVSSDLREIVSSIEPDALRELGLAAAITELTERHAARRGVAFELQLEAGDALGEGAQSGLYQITRDALDQAVRRGPPARIIVSILPADGGVELRIADDGPEERRQAVLDALAQRSEELNGTFSSETTASGTWIAIRLPPSATHL